MEEKNILVVVPVEERHKEKLEQAAGKASFTYTSITGATREQVEQADIIFGNVAPGLLKNATRLQWLQLNSAGADPYVPKGILPENAILTSSSGAYGKAVAQHMFAMLLAMQKKLHLYRDDQRNHVWGDRGNVTSIEDSKVLVVGAGDIGTYFAKLAHALGAYVIGVKRTQGPCPESMDELHTMEDLEQLLPQADAVVSFLPSTEETRGMFNARLFTLMKAGSNFLNGGRGNTVHTEDLCQALVSGHLAGAALDVTYPEPLPEDHPLWDIPNAYITPHVSGFYHLPETLDRVVDICTENLRRYRKGEPLKNVVAH